MSLQTKTRSYDYPMPAFDGAAAMQMSGLEYLQALTGGRIGAEPSIGPTIGMHIPHELGEGHAVVDATPGDYVLNPMGGVHGGFAATVLDSALGLSIHTTLQAGGIFDRRVESELYPPHAPGRRPDACDRHRDPSRPPDGHRRGATGRGRGWQAVCARIDDLLYFPAAQGLR